MKMITWVYIPEQRCDSSPSRRRRADQITTRVIQGDGEHTTVLWHLCKQSKLGRRCILQCSLLRAVSLSHTPTSILLLAKSLSNHLLLRLRGRGSVSTNPPFKRKWFYFVWLHIQTRTKKAKNFEHATTIFVPIHLCNAQAIIEKFCCSLKMERKKNENANRGEKNLQMWSLHA